jgi:pimeloyl-ACP methyl ester carboxylesterase
MLMYVLLLGKREIIYKRLKHIAERSPLQKQRERSHKAESEILRVETHILAMGFGVVSILNAVFRRAFTSAGLRSSSAAVDADTTLHFWASPSLVPPSSDSKSSSKNGSNIKQRRPVVVLIHGFGPDPTWQWASQVGPLSRHFDILVPTLLFFGPSTTRAPDRSDAFQAANIAALLAGVGGGEEEPREVHVVGTSYGGLVAYHLARALQVQGGRWRVGKVALCSSDLTKGPEDDRVLAAKGGVAEVTELMVPADTKALRRLMAIGAHDPPNYLPECLARELLRVRIRTPAVQYIVHNCCYVGIYMVHARPVRKSLVKGTFTLKPQGQLKKFVLVVIIYGLHD